MLGPGEAVLKERWTGWYLVGGEGRDLPFEAFGGPVAIVYPVPLPAPMRDDYLAYIRTIPTRAFTAPRRVCCVPEEPVTPVPTVAPGPSAAPSVKLRARALRRGARVTVARVTCPNRCTVSLSVADRRRTIRRTLRVQGSAPVSILRGARLRPGRLRVRVAVDGRPLASGFVRLR